jgi:hypothetical protein
MFISKKKFNEVIKQAKEEVYVEMGRRDHEKEREDYISTCDKEEAENDPMRKQLHTML